MNALAKALGQAPEMGIYSKSEYVTPAIAESWLLKNNANRPVKKSHIKSLAQAMKRGEWMLNGESIKFDHGGNLIDGQHRLQAVVMADVSVPMIVMRNLDPRVFATIDTGVVRGGGDALALKGFPLAFQLSGATKYIIAFETRGTLWNEGGNGIKFTNAQVVETIARHPDLANWVEKTHPARYIVPTSPLAAVCYLSQSKTNGHKVDAFVDALITGAGLSETDPAYLLRERAISARQGINKLTRKGFTALLIKSLNAYRAGRAVKMLKWSSAEQFPEIED